MNKESAPEELIRAIRKVLSGGRYASDALAEKLSLDLGGEGVLPIDERLSERELEVLRMIGSGKTISRIAEELHLSVTTASTKRACILEKMKMTTTAELMDYALRTQLADLQESEPQSRSPVNHLESSKSIQTLKWGLRSRALSVVNFIGLTDSAEICSKKNCL